MHPHGPTTATRDHSVIVRELESRARGLRIQSCDLEPVSAQAFRRRVSALELMGFLTRIEMNAVASLAVGDAVA